MDKKVTGRTDQGTKKYPGDEAYKKLFAKMLEEDKKKEKKKSEKKISAKESKGLLKADDSSIKKIHGTISKLAGHVRKAVIRIGSLEKRADKIKGRANKIEEKTSKIVNILKSQKSKIGEKLPGSNRDSLNKTLIETNKILVDIQKQLTLQSKDEEKQQKEKSRKDSVSESKKKLKAEESLLEKTSKGIGKVVGKVASKTLDPISGIFDKIVEFITLLGAGIATNAAFEWFKDEENQKKITKFFNILKENWQLLAKILGTLAIGSLAIKLAGVLLTLKSILAICANPLFIAGIGIIMAAAMQGLGRAEKEVVAELETQDKDNPYSKENRERLIKKYEAKIDEIAPDTGSFLGRVTLDPGTLSDLRHKIRFLKTGRYDYGGKQLTFDFGISDFNYNMGSKFNFDTGQEESLYGDEKRPGFDFGGERAMGGPVTKGQSYLVGERGPEIFSTNINGSIVNNMRTEKIVQTLSSDMREGSINMIELPPITNQMPPPEIPVPTQQATDVPEISSTNMTDPYRQLSPLLYGITV